MACEGSVRYRSIVWRNKRCKYREYGKVLGRGQVLLNFLESWQHLVQEAIESIILADYDHALHHVDGAQAIQLVRTLLKDGSRNLGEGHTERVVHHDKRLRVLRPVREDSLTSGIVVVESGFVSSARLAQLWQRA